LKNPKETSVSVITPPKVTLGIVKSCIELGIQNVWLQPGSESDEAIKIAKEHGLNIIYGGPCVLVSGLTAYEQSRL
jgi:predicted CoA-binding protein